MKKFQSIGVLVTTAMIVSIALLFCQPLLAEAQSKNPRLEGKIVGDRLILIFGGKERVAFDGSYITSSGKKIQVKESRVVNLSEAKIAPGVEFIIEEMVVADPFPGCIAHWNKYSRCMTNCKARGESHNRCHSWNCHEWYKDYLRCVFPE